MNLNPQLIIARVLADDDPYPGEQAFDTASAILDALADAGYVVELEEVINASLQ